MSMCYMLDDLNENMPFDLEGDKFKEECGVFGVFSKDNESKSAEITYYGLYALQHRGQESAGIVVSDGEKFKYHKGMGLVSDVLVRKP